MTKFIKLVISKIRFEISLILARILINFKPKNRYMIIDSTEEVYFSFSACYMKDILSLAIYAICRGYKPLFKVKAVDGSYIHDTYFKQPYEDVTEKIHIKSPIKRGNIDITFMNMFRKDIRSIYSKVMNQCLQLNDETQNYFKADLQATIGTRKKVLGVLVRGTDYLRLKPAFHPVQPTIEDVISECKEIIEKYNYKYIYLATEEEKYQKLFEEVFPNMVLTNQRHYIGNQFWNSSSSHCYKVNLNIDNENYIKGIEYLSSLEILACCDSLIGGNCGGTMYAFLRNNDTYEFCKIFNLGLYPATK